MSISDFFEATILNHLLRNQVYTPPATIYVSLHTADPTDVTATALANEVVAGGNAYARKAATFSAASGTNPTQIVTSADLVWSNMPGATVTHAGLWDASSTGNLLWSGALTVSKTTQAADTLQIVAGQLAVQVD